MSGGATSTLYQYTILTIIAHRIRLFFVMLFLLGIDSAFSFMEGFLVCLQDASSVMANVKPKTTCFIITLASWLFSLLYATDAGK